MLGTKSIRIKKRDFKKQANKSFKKLLLKLFLLFILLSGVAAGGLFYYIVKDLPALDSIADYKPNIITKVYSEDEVQIGEFAIEKRDVIPISKAPKLLIQAFVAAEDDRFFEHEGIDFFSILRAFMINLKAGGVVQGGSTITQQVAKSLLTSERTFERKAKEAIIAYRIENNFSKNEILFLYLNQIYLGHGAYGVQAAAQNYFHKNVDEMTLAEMAILAGLPQAPSRFSPASNPEKARERQHYVLNRMVEEGYINIVESTDAMNTLIEVHPINDINNEISPYFTEHVRRYLEQKYGADRLYKDGLIVHTTVNVAMQSIAQKALKKGLYDLDRRQGYRGPIRHIAEEEIDAVITELQEKLEKNPIKEDEVYEGIVTEVNSKEKHLLVNIGKEAKGKIPLKDIRWARKPDPEIDFLEGRIRDPADAFSVGDLILVKMKGTVEKGGHFDFSLHQEPATQAALLTINPHNGHIKSMVGGFDFGKSKFNRAVQSRRQPGSAFKPILYAAALDNGYTPASIIIDSPIIYRDDEEALLWKPQNYEEKFYGPTTLRKGLTKSRNVVSIKIMQDLGIDYVINYARRLGIKSHLDRDLSLALGSSGLSLQELTSAFSIFAAGGKRHEPIFITKILDREGNILESTYDTTEVQEEVSEKTEEEEGPEQVKPKEMELPEALRNLPEGYAISPQTAYHMSSLLQGVVQHGTGWRAKALKRPVAGKTGTTNDLYDAWFVGFTPDLVTGTWVGFDQEQPIGKHETGSRAASPIFVNFMKEVYEGRPVEAFPIPEKIVFARIDAKSGLLAPPAQKENVIFEAFTEGTVPTKQADQVIDDAKIFRDEF